MGDAADDLKLGLLTDAAFAGDHETMRSASGVVLVLYGPHSFFPLCGQSKKQTAVSHSIVEAELVSCDLGLRTMGLPALTLWEVLLGRPPKLDLYQGTQATMRILQTGKAPTLRHIKRTHQVSIAWLHERIGDPQIELHGCITDVMAADIFT